MAETSISKGGTAGGSEGREGEHKKYINVQIQISKKFSLFFAAIN